MHLYVPHRLAMSEQDVLVCLIILTVNETVKHTETFSNVKHSANQLATKDNLTVCYTWLHYESANLYHI